VMRAVVTLARAPRRPIAPTMIETPVRMSCQPLESLFRILETPVKIGPMPPMIPAHAVLVLRRLPIEVEAGAGAGAGAVILYSLPPHPQLK